MTDDFREWIDSHYPQVSTLGDALDHAKEFERATGKDATDKTYELDRAAEYWEYYSALPKRVAFKDGRLLAFMATAGLNRGNRFCDLLYDAVGDGETRALVEDCLNSVMWDVENRALSQTDPSKVDNKEEVLSRFSDELFVGTHEGVYQSSPDIEITREIRSAAIEAVRKWLYDEFEVAEEWWDRNDEPHASAHDCILSTPRTE